MRTSLAVPVRLHSSTYHLKVLERYYYNYNHFMALWTLSRSTWVSQHRKVHFAIFWIFWCKMKITQADAQTIQMDCHPSRLIGAHTSTIPTIFTPHALPDTTLPIYPGLGQALNMLACIPGGLVTSDIKMRNTCLIISAERHTMTGCTALA